MKRAITIISAAAVAGAAMASSAASFQSGAAGEGDAIKIMCIGDSITDGYGVAGSYRKFIYHELTKKGYSIDMVGTKSGDVISEYTDEETGETFTYDDGNTGYSGYAITGYHVTENGTSYNRDGILEVLEETDCLRTEDPDIVIIQIGTNDIIDGYSLDKAADRLNQLIISVQSLAPSDAKIVVTTIPQVDPNRPEVRDWFANYRHSADWQTEYTDEEAEVSIKAAVDAYNETVRKVVSDRIEFAKNNVGFRPVAPVFLAEADTAVTDVKTQLMDGVHPNNNGYKALGLYWADYLDGMLVRINGGQPVITPEATTAESTETLTEASTEAPTEEVTAPVVTSPAEEETEPPADDKLKISDMVRVSRWLLGYPNAEIGAEDVPRYDLDGSGTIDTFDLVLIRRTLLETCEKVAAKMSEKLGKEFTLFENGVDIVIIDPNAETEKVVPASSGSHSKFVAVNTEIMEFDSDEEAREWLEQHGFDPAVYFPEVTEDNIIS
ncbi:MAG: hypothetical protein J5501_08425 [Ruminococcus sp.]|nr:hypothetical protein [Ruminococcus sp.]